MASVNDIYTVCHKCSIIIKERLSAMGVDVIEVTGGRDLTDFIRFPYDLYKNHPVRVPLLKRLAAREFNRKTNGFFKMKFVKQSACIKGRSIDPTLQKTLILYVPDICVLSNLFSWAASMIEAPDPAQRPSKRPQQ
jgi:hypothetical protein